MDKKRYESIMKRDFKYNLELYIFHLILYDDVNNSTPEEFKCFKPEKKLIDDYRKAHQMKSDELFKNKSIKEIDSAFDKWYDKRELSVYKNLFYDIFKEKLKEQDFDQLIIKEKNQCHYCGIKESDIEELIKYTDIKTKRLLTRGRSMEIDRINPFGDYSENNIILSCYWCNNAKTDEFSYEEFKDMIAPGMTQVWSKRLGRPIKAPSNRIKNKNNARE